MKFNKKTILWLIIWCSLTILTIGSIIAFNFIYAFKYVLLSLGLLWAVAFFIRQFITIKILKKDLESKMPVYLADLYNKGIITKEQFENPSTHEKKMLFAEYSNTFRTRWFVALLLVAVSIYFFIFYF